MVKDSSQMNWRVFVAVSGENFKITIFFGIFAFGVVRKLLIWHNLSVLRLKSSNYADADVSKLSRSVSLHLIRCLVKRVKDESPNHNLNC